MGNTVIPSVTMKKLGNQYLVYNGDTSDAHVINETAGEILQWLMSGDDLNTVEQKLNERYPDVDKDVVKEDVSEIVGQFMSLGLVNG